MARDLPLSPVLSSRSHPNPPSATPAALFIFTSQQYPRAHARTRRERARGMTRERRGDSVSPVINFRPSTGGASTTTPSGTHRPPSLLSPSIGNMREGREGGGQDTRRPRETVFNGENYQIAPLPGLSIFMNSDERLHGITISPPPKLFSQPLLPPPGLPPQSLIMDC